MSIAQSCDSILNPEAPLALRLSGQLLLGVVRIYQRKLVFLETDARNAIDGLQRKEAGSHNVDLPDGGTAPDMAITLPETDMGTLTASDIFPSFAIADTPQGLVPAVSSLADRMNVGTESLTLADDLSDVFGSSRWTASDERFEIHGSGEDLDRRFSAELERLRSQAAVEHPREAGPDIFYDPTGADQMSFGTDGMDDIMEPPASDLFVMPNLAVTTSIGRTPGSLGVSDGRFAGARVTPARSFGFGDDLPEIGDEEFSMPEAPEMQQLLDLRERKRGTDDKRKRRIQMDVASDGTAATQLPSEHVRRLLNDRSSLLKHRSIPTEREDAVLASSWISGRDYYDIKAQSEAARASFEYRPACFQCLAPELLSVFQHALGVGPDGKLPSKEAARAKRRHDDDHVTQAREARLDANLPQISPPGLGPSAAEEQVPEPSPPGAGPGFPEWEMENGSDMGDLGDIYDDGGFDVIEVSQGGSVDVSHAAHVQAAKGAPTLDVTSPAPEAILLSETRVSDHIAHGLVEGIVSGKEEYSARDGFTKRTVRVLNHLQNCFAPSIGDKRPRDLDHSSLPPLSLDDIVRERSRLDACRWFFESLVLRNKGFLSLNQQEPYSDIMLLPTSKLFDTPKDPARGAGDTALVSPASTKRKLTSSMITSSS